jgi:hypothetical protein
MEGTEATPTESSNPFVSLATESSPEDMVEGDLSQRPNAYLFATS